MLRIGMHPIGGDLWMGGYNYQVNLARTVSKYAAGEAELVIGQAPETPEARLQPFRNLPGVTLDVDPLFSPTQNSARLRQAMLTGVDSRARDFFQRHRCDVVFENATYFGWRFPFPTLAWIPDFRHRYLPFPRGMWLRREFGFRMQIATGRQFMLSSGDAEADCVRFYPATKGRTNVVRFAVPPPKDIPNDEIIAIRDGLGLPEDFFFLPNQFWWHKNHELAADALRILKDRGVNAVIAASGNTTDPENPGRFDALMQHVKNRGVEDRFRMLGQIPYHSLVALIRGCRALINPSRFEGWSTTVEEAKALGAPMLLSGIGVHREQAEGMAVFFDCDDAAGLADAMQRELVAPRGPAMLKPTPVALNEQRERDFAASFVRAAQATLAARGRRPAAGA